MLKTDKKNIQQIYQHFATNTQNVNRGQILQLIIGVTIFLIITALTYYILSPPTHSTNTTTNAMADMTPKTITNTTNTTSDISPLTNIYRIMTSITAGGVIGVVTLSFLYPASRH